MVRSLLCLTLTLVVFEYEIEGYSWDKDNSLTLTLVVFEYEIEGYSWDKDNSLTLTLVVFECYIFFFK